MCLKFSFGTSRTYMRAQKLYVRYILLSPTHFSPQACPSWLLIEWQICRNSKVKRLLKQFANFDLDKMLSWWLLRLVARQNTWPARSLSPTFLSIKTLWQCLRKEARGSLSSFACPKQDSSSINFPQYRRRPREVLRRSETSEATVAFRQRVDRLMRYPSHRETSTEKCHL